MNYTTRQVSAELSASIAERAIKLAILLECAEAEDATDDLAGRSQPSRATKAQLTKELRDRTTCYQYISIRFLQIPLLIPAVVAI